MSWDKLHAELKPLLCELLECPAKTRREHSRVPEQAGVYLFSENRIPMYVGQTRNLRQRIGNHTIPSARETQASLAFTMAMHEATCRGITIKGTRKQIARHPQFEPLFSAAKARVGAMDVQFSLTNDPELRTVFEVYAALELPTCWNKFETH